ncbi:hypothetical protein WR25_18534 isoform B [Diploscapter pachys]|nr:hypothetical protein WR25_18534 isoform B [Diploscapter pachys]
MEYNDAQDQEQEIALPEPESVVYGQWSVWSAYTPCSNGERTRVRTCLSRKYALKVICHGVSIEVQRCFSSAETHVPVAQDPYSIEKEISGDKFKF